MVWSEKNPVTTPGIDPGTFRLVAQRLNHYATPGPMGLIMAVRLHNLGYFKPQWNRNRNICNQSHESGTGKLVYIADITRFIVDAFRKAGTQDNHALRMARTLVTADLKGHFSHGLNRLGKLVYTRGVQVVRYPNFFLGNGSR